MTCWWLPRPPSGLHHHQGVHCPRDSLGGSPGLLLPSHHHQQVTTTRWAVSQPPSALPPPPTMHVYPLTCASHLPPHDSHLTPPPPTGHLTSPHCHHAPRHQPHFQQQGR